MRTVIALDLLFESGKDGGGHPGIGLMSITLQLDIPDALLNDAKANGLLESKSLAEMLTLELKRRSKKDVHNPLLPDPELQRVTFFEDPAAPLDPQDWPEAFE